MKTLAEAAMDLPWLAPSAASLTVLAKTPLSAAWQLVRTDPGIILLIARHLETPDRTVDAIDSTVLESLLHQQKDLAHGVVDWDQTGVAAVHDVACRTALLASQLAVKVGVDERTAWVAGLLAPIGWLALSAVNPAGIQLYRDHARRGGDLGWQKQAWGTDHATLARRMCRQWRLPAWLLGLVGNLDLPPAVGVQLGAPAQPLMIVQLASALLQARGVGVNLRLGATPLESMQALNLPAPEAEALADAALNSYLPPVSWQPATQAPLLIDLLELGVENRRLRSAQQEVDNLQQALFTQCATEHDRMLTAKLLSLAEFAAGAGHEINNPLAVISGQAQYVLKQLEWLDVPANEIVNPAEYLGGIRDKVKPSLDKIIGQTQRIHGILTDMMRFARPHKPNVQLLSIRSLIMDVTNSLEPLAKQRDVRVGMLDIVQDEIICGDHGQVRAALSSLVKNAIEAAPRGGWAAVRMMRAPDHQLDIIVEDNGAGPALAIRDHLFDPFFSGRSAGRGRGMGLPTAWRFARQQGGDVRFDCGGNSLTRFILTMPLAPSVSLPAPDGGPKLRIAA